MDISAFSMKDKGMNLYLVYRMTDFLKKRKVKAFARKKGINRPGPKEILSRGTRCHHWKIFCLPMLARRP